MYRPKTWSDGWNKVANWWKTQAIIHFCFSPNALATPKNKNVLRASCLATNALGGESVYKIAATPAATAPMTINPFEMIFEVAALLVDDALDPVALAVLEPEPEALLLEPESSVAAPKTPP